MTNPRASHIFAKKLFLALEMMLKPGKTFKLYYEMKCRVRRYVRARFCNLVPNKLPVWPDVS